METTGKRGGGAGGGIDLSVAGTLNLGPSGLISASTLGDGLGGGIGVNARRIRIESGAGQIAGIFAEAAEDSMGNGGNLSVSANDLSIAGAGAIISATSKGSGRSGNVRVEAENVKLTDGARVASENIGTGDGGSVSIRADHLLSLGSGSLVSTSALSGDAGEIALSSADRIEVGERHAVRNSELFQPMGDRVTRLERGVPCQRQDRERPGATVRDACGKHDRRRGNRKAAGFT